MSNKFNPEGPETMFVEADRLIEAGKTQEAAKLLSEIIEQYPDYGRAYNHMGYLWETKFRDFVKAEEHYKSCLRLCPDYPAVYNNFSVLLSSQNRYEELEALLKRALKVRGINLSNIHNEYGIMYEAQQKYPEALDSYRKAIQYSYSQKNIDRYNDSVKRVQGKTTLSKQFITSKP